MGAGSFADCTHVGYIASENHERAEYSASAKDLMEGWGNFFQSQISVKVKVACPLT